MGSFLDGLGTLFGGAGNAGAASSNAWNYGQYSPFTVNNPMGQTSFNGTTGTSSLSPLQQQLQGAFGGAIQGGLGGQYSPYNTQGLQSTYNSLYGGQNFQNGVNNNFQQSVQGIMPFMQQASQSNLDNEFSKGTLASTAGSYQTAGQQMGQGATLSNLYNQSYQNQLASSGQQWNAAMGQAGLGEQQAEFGPQFGLSQAQAGISGLQQQNTGILNQMQLAGNLGAQRSGANVSAATPGIGTGETQDQATAGLLSGLLFGGGTGGNLLSSLLGTNGGSGLAGLLGKGVSGLGSLFGGNSSAAGGSGGGGFGGEYDGGIGGILGSLGNGSIDSGQQTTNQDSGTTTQFGEDNWWGDTGFNSAGGEAANGSGGLSSVYNNASGNSNGFGSLLGTAGGALGAYAGLSSGTATGEAGGALNLAKLGAQGGLFGQNSGGVNNLANTGLNGLGLYTGLKQGGVTGYAQAANSAYGLASGTSGIPGVGQALSVYNAIKGYQSGDTGGDALRGAEAGASIGSIVPGIGTVVGGLIGGAVGALSSAFGSGKVDPENASFEGYTQAYNKGSAQEKQAMTAQISNPYQPLAGYFDLRSGQLKGSNPLYQQYGRMGEQKFTNDLVNVVDQGKAQGVSAQDMFSKVVEPWVDSKGTWQDSNKDAMESLIQNMTGQIYTGAYKTNFKAVGGDTPFG